jgi:sugar lactone lactonase YvrE
MTKGQILLAKYGDPGWKGTVDTMVEIVCDAHAGTAEGPLWDDRRQQLVWTDIPDETVHFTDLSSGKDTAVDIGTRVGCIVPRSGGGYALGTSQEFWLADDDDLASAQKRIRITDETLVRTNDGKCDAAGRFFAGTAAQDGRWGTGALYRLDADMSVNLVLPGVTCANGLGWSLDAKTMYYVDTPTYRIDAFDFNPESGTLSNRRIFARIEGGGRPDGLCIDSEGCLWVAIWLGWEVHRYAPDGRLLQRVSVPTAMVSSCAFGGPDLDVLCITSASGGLMKRQRQEQPHAGAIFAFTPGVQGLPAAQFKG